MQNDTQRKLFGQSLAKLRTAGLGAASGHESSERRQSLEESAQASIVGSINLAAAQAADGFAGYVPPKPSSGGKRPDGTEKANGFFGPLAGAGPLVGSTLTELSLGVPINGKEIDVPSLVPTLTKEEVAYITNGGDPRKNPSIKQKAIEHAEKRLAEGKSPFADNSESPQNPGDPIVGLKGDIIKRVQVMADLNGWSPERKALEEGKYLTSLHKQVLQSLVTNNPGKAKEYYDTYKNEIDGSERDGVDKFIKEGTLREVAQTAVDGIMSKGLGLSGALNLARQKYSGAEEDEITRRIKERFSEREASTGLGSKQSADAAWKIVAAGGGRDQIPPALWTSLKGEEQMQFVRYFDAKAAKGDKEGKDDIENLAQVETLIERGDLTNKAELAKYEPFFSKGTLKTLGTKIESRGRVNPKEMKQLFEERKDKTVSPPGWMSKARAEWMAFQNYMLENVKETKRPEDMDVWADRWFMKGYGKTDKAFTNDPDTFGEAKAKGRKDFVIATPESVAPQVDQTLAILQKNGVALPKNKKLARDEFYTTNVLEADRWAAAHEVVSTPEFTAAYALLKQNKKPITPANMDYVLRQLKK